MRLCVRLSPWGKFGQAVFSIPMNSASDCNSNGSELIQFADDFPVFRIIQDVADESRLQKATSTCSHNGLVKITVQSQKICSLEIQQKAGGGYFGSVELFFQNVRFI